MAAITFQCAHCGQSLECEDTGAGMQVECPSCNKTLTVPAPTQIGQETTEPPETPTEETEPVTSQDEQEETAERVASDHTTTGTMKCANCGAQLDADGQTEKAKCLFCGSTNVLTSPETQLARLRDIENPKLSITHQKPTITFEQVRHNIVARISADDCGLQNAARLLITVKGAYFPTWDIRVRAQCCWSGENSRRVPFTNYRTVTRQVGNRTVSHQEPYTDHRTEWYPVSGQKFFSTSVSLPAGEGLSVAQLEMVSESEDPHLGNGYPPKTKNFTTVPVSKEQSHSWEQYNGDGRVNASAQLACGACAERISDVSADIQGREFSLNFIPFAVATYTANGTEYRHFVNLQNGQFSGDVPLDIAKVATEGAVATRATRDNRNIWRMGWAAIGVYAIVTVLVNLGWRDWNVGDAIEYGLSSPLAVFADCPPEEMLADSPVLTVLFSWIGWLATIIFCGIAGPKGNPWTEFLAKRQAFLLRLMMNPPANIPKLAMFASPDFAEGRANLKEMADEGDLDSIPTEAAQKLTDGVGQTLVATAQAQPTTRTLRTAIAVTATTMAILLVCTIVYGATAGSVMTARRVALVKKQETERLAKEDAAQQAERQRQEEAAREKAAKAEQAKQEAEKQRQDELAKANSVKVVEDRSSNTDTPSTETTPTRTSFTRTRIPQVQEPSFEDRVQAATKTFVPLPKGTRVVVKLKTGTQIAGTVQGVTGTDVTIALEQTLANLTLQKETISEEFRYMFFAEDWAKRKVSAEDYKAASDKQAQTLANMSVEDLVTTGLAQFKAGKTSEAYQLFRRAANSGDPRGQYVMGIYYLQGYNVVTPNSEEAMRWLTKAANQNHAAAQLELAQCYANGNANTVRDFQKAETYARAAIENGDKDGWKVVRFIQQEQERIRREQQEAEMRFRRR